MEIILTVGVLIIKDGNVLLVKHGEKTDHVTNTYGLPAGRIEEGETEKQAAIRELKEETGLRTTEEALEMLPLNIPPADIPRKDGTTKRFSITVFLCMTYSGELAGSDETAPEWIAISEIDNYQLIGYTKRMVEEGVKYL